MKKLVRESLDELFESLFNPFDTTESEKIRPEDFTEFVRDLIAMDDEDAAVSELQNLVADNAYMNFEFGEMPGHDKYKEGIDLFLKHYGWEPIGPAID